MEDYLNYLDSLLINPPLPDDRDLLSPQYVKLIVNQLFTCREKDGIHVQFPKIDSMAQKEIEKLAKLVLLSDSTVKMAVNTEPHAALALSGISLFLLVSNKQTLILYSGYFIYNNRFSQILESTIRRC